MTWIDRRPAKLGGCDRGAFLCDWPRCMCERQSSSEEQVTKPAGDVFGSCKEKKHEAPTKLFVHVADICAGVVSAATYPFPGATEYVVVANPQVEKDDKEWDRLQRLLTEVLATVDVLEQKCGAPVSASLRAVALLEVADKMAEGVRRAVQSGALDSRSMAADAELIYTPRRNADAGSLPSAITPLDYRWRKASVTLPAEGEEVLIWHVLGDQARSPHAYDVAYRSNGEWCFPWDREKRNPPPQWVRAWMPIPAVDGGNHREGP